MPLNLELVPGTLPAGYCFTTWQETLNTFMDISHAVFPGNFTAINFGDTEPTAENRDKPWIRTVSGQPNRTYVFFNGEWASLHPVPASSSSRQLWVGAEADVWAYDGGDGIDPGVTAPTSTTGAMWEVDHDFDARVLLGPGTLPVAATIVAVGDVGGVDQFNLTTAQLAAHSHNLVRNVSSSTGIAAGTDTIAADGTGAGDGNYTLTSAGAASGNPATTGQSSTTGSGDPVNNMPPYRGIFVIKRTARQFYTV